MDLTTGAGGITGPEELPEGTSYQVQITDPRFSLWQPAGDLDVSTPAAEAAAAVVRVPARGRDAAAEDEAVEEAAEEALAEAAAAASAPPLLDVTLVPQAGRRLVVVRRVTDDGQPVTAGMVTIRSAGSGFSEPFSSFADGNVYAVAPIEAITVDLASPELREQMLCPQAFQVPYTVVRAEEVRPLEFIFWPAVQIVATPIIADSGGGKAPLYGTTVQVQHQVNGDVVSRVKTLEQDPSDPSGEVWFEYYLSGEYDVTVKPPDPTYQGLPISPGAHAAEVPLVAPFRYEAQADFHVVPTEPLTVGVQLPLGKQQLTGPAEFEVYNGGTNVTVSVDPEKLEGTVTAPKDIPLKIRPGAGGPPMVEGDSPRIGAVPLQMSDPDQAVVPGPNTIVLAYEHSLTINAMDEMGRPVPGGMVDVYFEQDPHPLATITVGSDGSFLLGLAEGGTYYLAEHLVAGQGQRREGISVRSPHTGQVTLYGAHGGNRGGGGVTDLSAYPVLTEEVSTIGPPAPAAGAPGPGGPGAGYGQTVDQVMRDVLGWRPSGDVAGFQSALTGAFQLKAVEGHTEWTWQQRGYAVQADMGALTGAQASIYARAKAALDQIQPLLIGITPLNALLYPLEDLESIRSIIGAELQELVNELALEGGPRIQRVNELFALLTQQEEGTDSWNPDLVQGHLGTMRDRFGLTVQWVETVDDERILTNFRILVEQVLALQKSWFYDRDLLRVVDSRSSLGTILIWLSRGLEAVCESVDDLTFSLDSVYVDSAQRQVIELRFGGHRAPMLLSDLLDWVVRACRDEGPRMIQDSGKDGVQAFAPVIKELRSLIEDARGLIERERKLPDGLRTPRVRRAFQVLVAQLDEVSRLANLIQPDLSPQIEQAWVTAGNSARIPLTSVPRTDRTITIEVRGTNFRRHASVILIPASEQLYDLVGRGVRVSPPNAASAVFANPLNVAGGARTHWSVLVTNEDGTQSSEFQI